jgi:hypothetical protein
MERKEIPGRLERVCNFPYLQKGRKRKVENYRGIALLNTVSERMKREIQ